MIDNIEKYAIPGVGAIIEKEINGENYILIQDRVKDRPLEGSNFEIGLLEIPAGKIQEYENVYTCLRREVIEETGLTINKIQGEENSEIISINGYKVLNYTPFSNSQNIEGYYPIMVQVFICNVKESSINGYSSNESKNVRWEKISIIKKMLNDHTKFYPMHISMLQKYIKYKDRDK